MRFSLALDDKVGKQAAILNKTLCKGIQYVKTKAAFDEEKAYSLVGLSDCRIVGLSDCRIVALSHCRIV